MRAEPGNEVEQFINHLNLEGIIMKFLITGLLHFWISRSIVPAVQLASAIWGVASVALGA